MKHILPLIILVLIFLIGSSVIKKESLPVPTPSPFPYQIPRVPTKQSYLTYLVGDSMIAALGENDEGLRQNLIKYYPGHEFVNYNYGFAATNIESLPARLSTPTTFQGRSYRAILTQEFDLIIIESFGYNPLSHYSLSEGLKKQTEILDKGVREIISTHPGSVIAIMTPIAPNKELFAKGAYDLSPSQKETWVTERISYIKNAIEFAKQRNIPLIDVYEKTLTASGDGDLKYIDKKDHIHPSAEGIILMNRVIADFIFQNHIFPQ